MSEQLKKLINVGIKLSNLASHGGQDGQALVNEWDAALKELKNHGVSTYQYVDGYAVNHENDDGWVTGTTYLLDFPSAQKLAKGAGSWGRDVAVRQEKLIVITDTKGEQMYLPLSARVAVHADLKAKRRNEALAKLSKEDREALGITE